ncbi:MAG: 50S ribosomal protein L9 [Chlamydiales bacterium]|nr:50S ribosomal protein L9 [Chlamydiales bacterium]
MTTRRNNQELLLLHDVRNLGRKGEIISGAKPGFVRNFLIPQGFAVMADKRTIRMQERLKEERRVQSEADRKEAKNIANNLKDKTFRHVVKADGQGHLYGSVSAQDIVEILAAEGVTIERKMVLIGQPIRKLGIHTIPLRLKEDVEAHFSLRVEDEKGRIEVIVAKEEPKAEEIFAEAQEADAAIDQQILREDAEQGQ